MSRKSPLPHGHRRDDVIGEVGGRLGHVAAVAGRADAAALAGECHDESRAARHADRAGEAEAEDAALEIAAEFVLDVSRHDSATLLCAGLPTPHLIRPKVSEPWCKETFGRPHGGVRRPAPSAHFPS